MKNLLHAASISLAGLATSATADDITILEVPATCSAIQVGVDTILLCNDISNIDSSLMFSQTGSSQVHIQGGTVDSIVTSNDFLLNSLDEGNSVKIDSDNDGEYDITFQLDHRDAPILSLFGSYGIIENETWNCYSYEQNNQDVLNCKDTEIELPTLGYKCLHNLNTGGGISMDGNQAIFFSRDNHSICTRDIEGA